MAAADYGLRETVVKEIVSLAEKNRVEKLVLFGSRAKGDYTRSSDIDLAVYGGNVDAFALEAEETVETLLFFDVIDMSAPLSPRFRNQIEGGVVLYEKV